MSWAPGWVLVSDTLLADAMPGLPLQAYVSHALLTTLTAEIYHESTASAVDLLERGTATWDATIFEDEGCGGWWE